MKAAILYGGRMIVIARIIRWTCAIAIWLLIFFGIITIFGGDPYKLSDSHGFWVLLLASFCAYAPAIVVISKSQFKLPMLVLLTLTEFSSMIFDVNENPNKFLSGSTTQMIAGFLYGPLFGGFAGALLSAMVVGLIRDYRGKKNAWRARFGRTTKP